VKRWCTRGLNVGKPTTGESVPRRPCPHCGRVVAVNKHGTVVPHYRAPTLPPASPIPPDREAALRASGDYDIRALLALVDSLRAQTANPPPRTEPSAPSAEGRDALIVKVTREATRRRSVKWRDVKGEAAIVAAVLSEVDALYSAHSNAPRAITAPSFASPITKLDGAGREVAEPCSPAPEPSAPSEAVRALLAEASDAVDRLWKLRKTAIDCGLYSASANASDMQRRMSAAIVLSACDFALPKRLRDASALGPPPSAPSPDDGLLMSVAEAVQHAEYASAMEMVRHYYGDEAADRIYIDPDNVDRDHEIDLAGVVSTARRPAKGEG
jgi:hypothetical protein